MDKQTISTSIWFIAAIVLLCAIAVVAMDAKAQVGPTPTPTITPMILPTPRPISICQHPLYTCIYLPTIVKEK